MRKIKLATFDFSKTDETCQFLENEGNLSVVYWVLSIWIDEAKHRLKGKQQDYAKEAVISLVKLWRVKTKLEKLACI